MQNTETIFTQAELDKITAEQKDFLRKNCTEQLGILDWARLANGAVQMYFKTIKGTVDFLEEMVKNSEHTELSLRLLEKYAAIAKKFYDITNEDSLLFLEEEGA